MYSDSGIERIKWMLEYKMNKMNSVRQRFLRPSHNNDWLTRMPKRLSPIAYHLSERK